MSFHVFIHFLSVLLSFFFCLLMICSYVIAFSHQNYWTSKHHDKALDVIANQCLILAVGIFKEFDGNIKTFVDSLVLVESYQKQFKQLE